MKTIRIHFLDLSCIDAEFSDSQAEEFERWLRFSNQNWTYSLPGGKKEIKRKDISRTEIIPSD